MEKRPYTQEEIIKMVKRMEPETIQRFLLTKSQDDQTFRQCLGDYLTLPDTLEVNAKNFENNIRKAIDKAFDEIEDEWGYSDYSDTEFVTTVERILRRVRKDYPEPESRICLQIEFLRKFDVVTNYDQQETFGEFIEDVVDDFEKIYIAARDGQIPDVRRYLCDASIAFLNHYDEPNDQIDHVEYFLLERFSKLFPQNIKGYLEGKISVIKNSEKVSEFNRDYYLGSYVRLMMDFLSQEGKTEEELYSLAKKYWRLEDTRQWFIRYYTQKEEWNKAMSLLHKSIEKDKESPKLVAKYKKQIEELSSKISQNNK